MTYNAIICCMQFGRSIKSPPPVREEWEAGAEEECRDNGLCINEFLAIGQRKKPKTAP